MHAQSKLRSQLTSATLGALALACFTTPVCAEDGLAAPSSEAEPAPRFLAPEEPEAPSNVKIVVPPEPVYLVDDELRPALPYRDGTRVPRGYRLEESPRFGLVGAGAATSAALWIASTISAISLDKKDSVNGDPNFGDRYWPMFIPVVGPFATIATANASGTGAGILALDGAFQAGGLAMMIAGLVATKAELIPQKGVYLGASAAKGSVGMSLNGSF